MKKLLPALLIAAVFIAGYTIGMARKEPQAPPKESTTEASTRTSTHASTTRIRPNLIVSEAIQIVRTMINDERVFVLGDITGSTVEQFGEHFYDIQALHDNSHPDAPTNGMTMHYGWFYVNAMTGEVYEHDMATGMYVPLHDIVFLRKDADMYDMCKQELAAMFPGEHIYSYRLIEREGREYYAFSLYDKEATGFPHTYYCYDLKAKQVFRWNLETGALEGLE